MAKFQSPLLGYNNNVRHRGRVFHIQTEDSGVNHPHIITHLFMDGGRILKSVKRSYAEHVGTENMSETVRVLMKEQHKAMFIALRDGQFDELAFGATKPSGAIAAPKAEAKTERATDVAPPPPPKAEAKTERATDVAPAPPPKAEAKSERATDVAPPAPPKVDAKSERAVDVAPPPPPKAEAKSERAVDVAPPPPPKVDAKSDRAIDIAPPAPPLAEAKTERAINVPPAARPRPPVPPPAPVVPPPAPSGPDVGINPSAVAAVVTVSSDRQTAPSQRAVHAEIADSRPSPSTRPGPPRSFTPEDMAPATIDDGDRTFVSQPPNAEPPLPPELEALLRDELSPPPAPTTTRTRNDEAPNTMREPARRRSAQELTLDFDALERDSGPSPIFQRSDLPPPPKNLFAKEPRTGTYSAVEADAHQEAPRAPAHRAQVPTPPARAPEQALARPAPPSRTPTPKPPSEGRYAPARPAAIFGAASQPPSSSIFGDDLVSDKSLDEVILSYLAEDLDPPRRK